MTLKEGGWVIRTIAQQARSPLAPLGRCTVVREDTQRHSQGRQQTETHRTRSKNIFELWCVGKHIGMYIKIHSLTHMRTHTHTHTRVCVFVLTPGDHDSFQL